MNPETNTPLTPSPLQPSSPLPKEAQKEDPGQIFGILSIASIPLGLSLVGIILSIIGKKKSKEAGHNGNLSNIGLILCSISTILIVLFFILAVGILGPLISGLAQKCQELGPGEHFVDGVTYTCGKE